MNLFWQITMIEFLLNVAVFAAAIIFYGPIRLFASRFARGRQFPERVAAGMLFGMATSATFFLPVHLEGGAAVGCGTILLALAGPLDGSLAILGALVFSVAMELLPWATMDQSNHTALFSLLVAATVSAISWAALKYSPFPRKRHLRYVDLPVIGMLSAAGGLAVVCLDEGRAAVSSALLPALISNILAALILGTLLLHEKRRSEAERNLRESEAHLVGQAKELALSRDTAESANRAKSMFLANMSHELRTPLNAILGYAQLLLRAPNLTESQIGACNTIQQSGEHLLMLIIDILDLAKIEAGRLELELGAVDLHAFLTGIANIIRIKAEDKALGFTCTLALDLPAFVQVDQKRLRQVLLNLLSNAVKFTDVGGVDLLVKVLSRSPEEAQLSFEVRDTGTGIAPDQLEKVFRPFEQVGDTQHRRGGTGLGLSISRQLVRLMRSELQVESVWGRGSCFSFDIPAATVAPGQAPSQVGGQVGGYEGSRKRVLVVDDIDANRSVLSEILTTLGFEITQASNGLEALANAQRMIPDLMLVDVRMPEMGGLELMRIMQGLPSLCQVPVIAISAGVTNEKQRDCMAAGVKAFLTKPIELAPLLQEIGRLLNLTWIRESPQEPTRSGGDRIESTGIPDPAHMKPLLELAKAGNMRAIREKVEELAILNECYRPFADRIAELALGYQSKALLRLVEKCAAQQQMESTTEVTNS
jgi:signal transduction histidine kinase/FixJ family two-component response regulator